MQSAKMWQGKIKMRGKIGILSCTSLAITLFAGGCGHSGPTMEELEQRAARREAAKREALKMEEERQLAVESRQEEVEKERLEEVKRAELRQEEAEVEAKSAEEAQAARREPAMAERLNLVGATFDTITTATGRVYRDVTVKQITDLEVRIIHETGVASIRFEDLPVSLREKFLYDPQAYQAAIDEDVRAREANARVIAEARKAGYGIIEKRQNEYEAQQAEKTARAAEQALAQGRAQLKVRIMRLEILARQKQAELERAEFLDARRRENSDDTYYEGPSSTVMRKGRELDAIQSEKANLQNQMSRYGN